MPRVENREQERKEVWRASEQECFDSWEAQSLDDGWEEVREAHGDNGARLDENEKRLITISNTLVCAPTVHTTFGSEKACFSPTNTGSLTSSTIPSFSRFKRHCAMAVSSADKKEVLLG